MLAPMSRLVWVTGASSGIGAAVAAAYADTGATVLASARRDAPLRALAAAHPSVVPLPLDVTDRNRTGHHGYLTATFDALAAGSPPPISGQMAFHNLAIIEAARMATDARRAIDLTEL